MEVGRISTIVFRKIELVFYAKAPKFTECHYQIDLLLLSFLCWHPSSINA